VWRFAVTVRYVPAPTGQQYGGNFSKCCPVDAGILLVPCMPNKPKTIHGNNAFEGEKREKKTLENVGIATKSRVLAEDTRFELVRLLHQHAFQACAIDH
jgi:hypothetical protein